MNRIWLGVFTYTYNWTNMFIFDLIQIDLGVNAVQCREHWVAVYAFYELGTGSVVQSSKKKK